MVFTRTALIAEADPGDALLIELAFGRVAADLGLGFCRDGRTTIEYLKQYVACGQLPVLMILDLKLPLVDGFAVLSWVSCEPRLQPMRIAAFGDLAEPAEVERAQRAGAHICLMKPRGASGFM